MCIKAAEYIGEDCRRLSVVVFHNKGKKNAIKVRVVFDFSLERVELIKVYQAKRLDELKGVVRKFLFQQDWGLDVNTEIVAKYPEVEEITDALRLDMYYRAMESAQRMAA